MRASFAGLIVFLAGQDLHSQHTTNTVGLHNLWNFSAWDIILGILIIVSFVLIYAVGRMVSDVDNEVKKTKKNYIEREPNNNYQLENRIEKLENEVRQFRNEKRDSIANLNAVEKVIYEERPVEIDLKLPPKPAEEVFFMATPSGEKSFDVSAKTESFKATQSLYKFTVASNTNNATFVFQSDDTGIRDSVNSPHIYIEPVCEPQNALNQNARRITTTRPGTAEKRNDKWIVINKAQIKYE